VKKGRWRNFITLKGVEVEREFIGSSEEKTLSYLKKTYLEFLYFIFITMMRFLFFIFVFVIHVRNLQNRGVQNCVLIRNCCDLDLKIRNSFNSLNLENLFDDIHFLKLVNPTKIFYLMVLYRNDYSSQHRACLQ